MKNKNTTIGYALLITLAAITVAYLITSCAGCESAPKTAAEKKEAAKVIAETTNTVGGIVPFPWDTVVYLVGSIAATTMGVGAAYSKIKKPKAKPEAPKS